MIKWSSTLVRDLALRKCILVLGAGVSMNSENIQGEKPKAWRQFLETAVLLIDDNNTVKVVRQLLKTNDYLTACEVIKDTLGRSGFIDLVTEQFQERGFLPADIHKGIFELDSKIVITPNFDNIYDRYAQTESNGTVVIKRHTDDDLAELIRSNKRLIIKMHGSIEAPNDLIFTRSDYAKSRTKHSSFYSIFDALAVTHTFLFIGCGTNDPDIRLILEDYRYKFKYSREHYFTLPQNSNPIQINKILESTLNLKIVEYDPKNNHEELKLSINELVSIVDSKRQEISINQSW